MKISDLLENAGAIKTPLALAAGALLGVLSLLKLLIRAERIPSKVFRLFSRSIWALFALIAGALVLTLFISPTKPATEPPKPQSDPTKPSNEPSTPHLDPETETLLAQTINLDVRDAPELEVYQGVARQVGATLALSPQVRQEIEKAHKKITLSAHGPLKEILENFCELRGWSDDVRAGVQPIIYFRTPLERSLEK